MFLFILAGNVTGGEAETGLVYIPPNVLLELLRAGYWRYPHDGLESYFPLTFRRAKQKGR